MLQIVEQTKEEKMAMYMKLPKKQIAEMLINCNDIITALIQEKNCDIPADSNRALLRVEPVYDGGGTSVTTYKLVDENGNILMTGERAICEWCKKHGC